MRGESPPPPLSGPPMLAEGAQTDFSVDIISGFLHRLEDGPKFFITHLVFFRNFFARGPPIYKKNNPIKTNPLKILGDQNQ